MDKPKFKHMIKILGLISALSYVSVIIGIWIYANLQGYVYFSAGEPNPWIKYPEFVLGFIAIYVILGKFKEEIDIFVKIYGRNT